MFIPNPRILILTALTVYAGIVIAGVPVLSGLTNTTYTGGQGAIPIAGSVNFSGGISYAEGNIRFNVSNAAANDLIALTSSSTPNALGAISLVSSDVYLGDGTGNTRIGSIDQIEDGTGGNPLKILFSTPLENSGFESGTTGWTIVSEEYGDSADEINLDGFTIDLANDGVYAGGTGTVNTVAASNMTFTGSIAAGQGVGGTAALSLTSSGTIVSEDQNPPGVGNPDGYGSIHGPYATSNVFTVVDGDSLSLEFKAVGSGDDYEVFGLIRRVDGSGNFIDNNWPTTNTADNNVLLFAQRGNDTGGFVTITKAGLTAGSYRFQFVGGTYDYSGGYAVGSLLYVDNIRLVSATGVTDATVQTIAQQVTFDSGCPLDATTRNLDLSVLTQDANATNATANITVNPNPNDLDNDCIPDVTEGAGDTDGDGVADNADLDSDNDGLLDVTEGNVDSDSDGVLDFRDLDSDNDGIPDVIESGGSDPDYDGVVGTGLPTVDADGLTGTTLSAVDTDSDSTPNYLDLDSDGDTRYDLVEGGGVDANNDGKVDNFTDANTDGFADSIVAYPLPLPDTNGNGTPDYLEPYVLDTDNDGIPDSSDLDDDNDGISDADEGDGVTDTDGDGVPDSKDLDSDNDGLDDILENGGTDTNRDGLVDNFTDVNSDGVDDASAGAGITDTDNDGTPDFRDLDSDNDGMSDLIETGGTDLDDDGMIDDFVDSNSDGRDDNVALNPPTDLDRDNDGVLDFQSDASQEAPVETGTQGVGGCSIAENSSFDPVLLLLILISLGFVLSDYKRVSRIDHKE